MKGSEILFLPIGVSWISYSERFVVKGRVKGGERRFSVLPKSNSIAQSDS